MCILAYLGLFYLFKNIIINTYLKIVIINYGTYCFQSYVVHKGSYIPPIDDESITLIFSPGNDGVGTLANALKLFKVHTFTALIFTYFVHFIIIWLRQFINNKKNKEYRLTNWINMLITNNLLESYLNVPGHHSIFLWHIICNMILRTYLYIYNAFYVRVYI